MASRPAKSKKRTKPKSSGHGGSYGDLMNAAGPSASHDSDTDTRNGNRNEASSKATKPRTATKPAAADRRGRLRSAAARASWKSVPRETRNLVLNTFDSGVSLLTHDVPDNRCDEVHGALINARNRVAVALETLTVPPSKAEYSNPSATLVRLKASCKELTVRHASLRRTVDNQQEELQRLEDEKVKLQDFGKLPGKHHPLLSETAENELHLNFNSVR